MAITWPAKHPGANLDYTWIVPLDAGDSIVSASISKVTGSASIGASTISGNLVTAFVSGGADGETVQYAATATTTGGRTFDEIILQAIQASESSDPLVADFRMRYPGFASVSDATVDYWLTDAAREVDDSWPIEGDRNPAMMAVAAHNMMVAGVAGLGDGDISALLASGVTDFQSGGREGFRVSFAPAAIAQALDGGYQNTKPGQEYLRLLRRNKGGPGTTAPGAPVCFNEGFNGWAGPLPNGYPFGFN